MEYLNTSELILYAKSHVGSFLLLAVTLFISFLLAYVLGRLLLRMMDKHIGESVWLEEYEFTIHKAFIVLTTGIFTLLIAGSTEVFSQLSWALAPLAIVIVYTSRRTLQNITEYIFLLMEGKILEGQFITLREEEMHHNTSGKITQVDSRKCFLKTLSGGEIMVMHHNIFEGIVTNYSKSQIRRITLSFTLPLSYSFTDIEKEMRNFLDAHTYSSAISQRYFTYSHGARTLLYSTTMLDRHCHQRIF